MNKSAVETLRGRIIRGVGGLYGVSADAKNTPESSESEEYLCSARGIFRREGKTPLAGDDVLFEPDPIRPGYGNIVRIGARRSALRRPAAANVDQLLIVLTLSAPAPDFMLADKLILHALMNHITPAICFNKSDLAPAAAFLEEAEGYARAGFLTLRTAAAPSGADGADSDDPDPDDTGPGNTGVGGVAPDLGLGPETNSDDAASGSDFGLGPLADALRDKVTILAGQSGVGKSTLFNRILEYEHMPVGGMSRKILRGKHTTRHVELVRIKGGGWLIDSPGFSAFEAEVGNYRELDRFYPEFAPYRELCRFKECSHIHEPGCAVLAALGEGALHAGRHRRYAALYAEGKAADGRKYM
ncbi:MAG: ribosome small subunit-dependent GTPase A [Clostridiales bacterium]|jgi:ribosome biogenesis GTPase|nr:ribosome small subunit-dependent GTPase A [Clostridiales bacterium]